MAELSSKRAASLKATAQGIKDTSDKSLGHFQRAIGKGWDQFDRTLANIVYKRQGASPPQLTVSGFLIDVGIALLLGPFAGLLASEVAQQFLRPSVRSRVNFLQPISRARAGEFPMKLSDDLEAQIDKVVMSELQADIALRHLVPEIDDLYVVFQERAAERAAQQVRLIDFLDRKLFDLQKQKIETADTGVFKAITTQWLGDAVSEVASEEAREARKQTSRGASSTTLSAAAQQAIAGPTSNFLGTVQLKDQFTKFINEQMDLNKATLKETNWLIDTKGYSEELATKLETNYEKLNEEPAETVREAAIDYQARAFEAMLWVLWFIETTGKQVVLGPPGPGGARVPARSGTSATQLIGEAQTGTGRNKVRWNVERALVDYWLDNLVDPLDARGRNFRQRYKDQVPGSEQEALRQAEDNLNLHFFKLEMEIARMNSSGEKLLSLIPGAPAAGTK